MLHEGEFAAIEYTNYLHSNLHICIIYFSTLPLSAQKVFNFALNKTYSAVVLRMF